MSKPLPLNPHRGTKKSPQLTPRPELLPHRVWSFSIHARLMIEKQQAQEQRDLTVISSPTGSEENDELFRRICTYESQGSTNPVSITFSASPTTRSSTCDDVYHQRQAIGGPEASYRPNWVLLQRTVHFSMNYLIVDCHNATEGCFGICNSHSPHAEV